MYKQKHKALFLFA